MSIVRSLVYGLSGAAAAAALILACGDGVTTADAGDGGDAPVCDCPAAEPPLADRIVQVRASKTIGTDSNREGLSVSCEYLEVTPGGPVVEGILLGGKCEVTVPNADAQLESAGGCESFVGWTEEEKNKRYCCVADSALPHEAGMVYATAICLVPATAGR